MTILVYLEAAINNRTNAHISKQMNPEIESHFMNKSDRHAPNCELLAVVEIESVHE